jgi:DNA-binding transcriptional ArsR family regulator
MRDFIHVTRALADETRVRVLLALRKQERWIYYSLSAQEAPAVVRGALVWVEKTLGNDPRVAEDAKMLKEILKRDPTELCKKQCRK